MKWLLVVALTLAGLLILIVVIGALLPKKHLVSRTVSLHHPAEVVWGLISGPPTWRPDVTNYHELAPHEGRRMWRETDRHKQTITYEAIESVPPRRLVTKIAIQTCLSAVPGHMKLCQQEARVRSPSPKMAKFTILCFVLYRASSWDRAPRSMDI
jgi:hypothetical protein